MVDSFGDEFFERITEEWRISHHEELHILSASNAIRVVKSRSM
jgi:hypothetical protein